MEVCEGQPAPDKSDMGFSHKDALLIVCRTGGHSFIAMERSEHIGFRNAKVGAPFRDTDSIYLDS